MTAPVNIRPKATKAGGKSYWKAKRTQIGPKDQANIDMATNTPICALEGASALVRIIALAFRLAEFAAAGDQNADHDDDAARYLLLRRQLAKQHERQ